MLKLFKTSESHLPRLHEIQANRRAREMAGYPERNWSEFLDHWKTKMNLPESENRVIYADDQLVGSVAVFTRDGLREVGYQIDEPFWGKGIMSQALKLFFEEVKERPVHAFVRPENTPSIRILEKCGFQRGESKPDLIGFVLSR